MNALVKGEHMRLTVLRIILIQMSGFGSEIRLNYARKLLITGSIANLV